MRHLFLAFACIGAPALLGCSGGGPATSPALATGERLVTAIAVDGSFVYWSRADGAIRRVSIDGGDVETVVADLTAPDRIAVDASQVYWSTLGGQIGRAAKAGGAAMSVAEGEAQADGDIVGLQVDDTNVYWNRKQGDVRMAKKAGGAPDTLAIDATGADALALAGPTLFWTTGDATNGALREIPVGGGDVTSVVAALAAPRALATDGVHVCWSGLDPAALAMDPTSSAEVLMRAGLDGSDVRTMATGLANVEALAADTDNAYFTTLDGDVLFAPMNGGAPVSFATGPQGHAAIAVDATSVYWAHANGDAIFVAGKP